MGATRRYSDFDGLLRDGSPTLDGRRSRSAARRSEEMRRFGPYQPTGVIGDGGMGRIYRAEHVTLGRAVAIKLLLRRYVRDRSAVQRFFNEARLVNQIRHENIIDIYDFVEEDAPHGRIYYVMELLQGRTLADAIRDEPVTLARIGQIGAQICAALEAVHRAGVVHRDLKPDNVFLVDRGGQTDFVKLLDFGIAELSSTPTLERAHPPKTVCGTPAYMAPEVIRRQRTDHRADIYALGVMLYEMLAGRRPFDGGTIEDLLTAHLEEQAPPPSAVAAPGRGISPALDHLVARCLAKDPERRPGKMPEVSQALARALDPGTAGPPLRESESARRPGRRRPRPGRRRRWLGPLVAGGAVAVLAALASALSLWSARVEAEPGGPPLEAEPATAVRIPPEPASAARVKDVLAVVRARDAGLAGRGQPGAEAASTPTAAPTLRPRGRPHGCARSSARPAAPSFTLDPWTTINPFEEQRR